MIDLDRRDLLAMALLAPLATLATGSSSAVAQENKDHSSHMSMPDSTVHWEGNEQIAMLMYPGMTVMDLIGPHCMFGSLMGAKIHLVSKTMDPVTSDAGLTIVPTATFDTCPRELTVLFTPGGTDGTLAAATDPATLAFMADRGDNAKYVTSVCSGSLILGIGKQQSVREKIAGRPAILLEIRLQKITECAGNTYLPKPTPISGTQSVREALS